MDRSSVKKRISLGRKLLISIMLFSSVITLITTFIQMYVDYRHGVEKIHHSIEQVELSFLNNIQNSVWQSDVEAVQIQLNGLMKLQDMQYLEVKDDYDLFVSTGERFHRELSSKSR